MSLFKVRNQAILQGGAQIGANGTAMSALLSGSVAASMPGINASAIGTASAVITGMTAGGEVMLMGASVLNASLPGGFQLLNVYATGTNSASFNIYNTNWANGAASTIGIRYLGVAA